MSPKQHKLRKYKWFAIAWLALLVFLVCATNAHARGTKVPHEAGWRAVAHCESGGRWHLSTGNGYYGGLQFSHTTWRSLTHKYWNASDAPPKFQMRMAEKLRHRAGIGQWPVCGKYFY